MGRLSADAVLSIAESLIAIRSISPDVTAEARCAKAVLDAAPRGALSGTWTTPDGRPVVWMRATGKPGPAVLLLSHYDTVGVDEYGERRPFDPPALREAFLADPVAADDDDERLQRDLEEEKRAPGTWMFGRGALDMKSGIAAGIAAMHAFVDSPPAHGDVVLVVTPDEEHTSAGILTALPELARLKAEDDVRFTGALNLDFGDGPLAYAGVEGKLLLGLLAVGVPAHAGAPLEGSDAIGLAACIVTALTQDADAVGERGHVPVALSLRDLKTHYDVQTAGEAGALIHVPLPATGAREAFDALRTRTRDAATLVRERLVARRVQAIRQGVRRPGPDPHAIAVLGFGDVAGHGSATAATGDAQADALAHARAAAQHSDVPPPYALLYASPPFYPASSRCDGPLSAAVRHEMEAEGHEVRALYPYVSDACYLRWDEDEAWLAKQMPGFGESYALPIDAMRALDLDVINLGPWGRDAHGLHERVHAPYAFDTLPRLIEACARRALES